MSRLLAWRRRCRAATPRLQAWWRGTYVRNGMCLLRLAALCLQRWWRVQLLRREYAARIARQAAALRLQACWRGTLTRRRCAALHDCRVLARRRSAELDGSRLAAARRAVDAHRFGLKEAPRKPAAVVPVRSLPEGPAHGRIEGILRRRGVLQPSASYRPRLRVASFASAGAGRQGAADLPATSAAAFVGTSTCGALVTELAPQASQELARPGTRSQGRSPLGVALLATSKTYSQQGSSQIRLRRPAPVQPAALPLGSTPRPSSQSSLASRTRGVQPFTAVFSTPARSIFSGAGAPGAHRDVLVVDPGMLLTELLGHGLLSLKPQDAPWIESSGASDLEAVRTWLCNALPTVAVRSLLRVECELAAAAYAGVKSSLGPERLLWHGTSWESAANIVRHGFNRAYGGRHGAKLGRGTYFAEDPAYALRFCGRTSSRAVFLAGVLPGRSCRGQDGLVEPPRADETGARFDSTVDDPERPKVFCVFRDFQALPLYIAEVA